MIVRLLIGLFFFSRRAKISNIFSDCVDLLYELRNVQSTESFSHQLVDTGFDLEYTLKLRFKHYDKHGTLFLLLEKSGIFSSSPPLGSWRRTTAYTKGNILYYRS